MTEGRPRFNATFPLDRLRTLTFGSLCHAGTPSPLLSHAYSASYFAGVILTYITIITI
jgi:hypothetical protein